MSGAATRQQRRGGDPPPDGFETLADAGAALAEAGPRRGNSKGHAAEVRSIVRGRGAGSRRGLCRAGAGLGAGALEVAVAPTAVLPGPGSSQSW